MSSKLLTLSDRSADGVGGYVYGANTVNDPRLLKQGECQELINAFPANPPRPRNAFVDLVASTSKLGYGSTDTIYEPGGIYIIAPDGDEYVFCWHRVRGSLTEYGLEMWNITDEARSVLVQISFVNSDTLPSFKMKKLYNSIYCFFDGVVSVNRTKPYQTDLIVVYWDGSAWALRSMSDATAVAINQITVGDSELSTFDYNLMFHCSVVFLNKMWILGGYDGTTLSNKVYSSVNGISWKYEGVIPIAVWLHSVVVFNDKMWLVGGALNVAGSSVSKKVYSSSDGITWTEAGTDALPIALYSHSCVLFGGKMWVAGGYSGGYSRKVYSSSDGITWTEAGTNALPVGITSHSSVSYDNKMWVIGGSISGTSFIRKVYSSSDGITWTEAGTDALPIPKAAHSSVVFNNKIWVICGATTTISLRNTIYSTYDGITWTQAIGGVLKNRYSSFSFTFVKRTLPTVDVAIFEEPELEAAENFDCRQIIKMLCTTASGVFLIPLPETAIALGRGMTHIRVWRTLSDASATVVAGLPHKYLVDISLANTTSYVYHDRLTDEELAGETHELNTIGYEVAPSGRFASFTNDRLWVGGVPSKKGYWYFSAFPENTAKPQKYCQLFNSSENFVVCDPEDGQDDTGCIEYSGSLYFFKERKLFVLTNADVTGAPMKIADIGCTFPNTIIEINNITYGHCVFFLSEQGPAIISSGGSVQLLSTFKLSEVWPGGELQLPPTDYFDTTKYDKNRVTATFYNGSIFIFYGDEVDAQLNIFKTNKLIGYYNSPDGKSFGGFKLSTQAASYAPVQLFVAPSGKAYTLSHRGALAYAFIIGGTAYSTAPSELKTLGSSGLSIGQSIKIDYVSTSGGASILNHSATIQSIENRGGAFRYSIISSVPALSGNYNVTIKAGTLTYSSPSYKITQFLKPDAYIDSFLSSFEEAKIQITARSRALCVSSDKKTMATLWNAFAHYNLKDSETLTLTLYADLIRSYMTGNYTQSKDTALPTAADAYIRNTIEIVPADGFYGLCFDGKIQKILPADGVFLFFGFDFNVLPEINVGSEFTTKLATIVKGWQ